MFPLPIRRTIRKRNQAGDLNRTPVRVPKPSLPFLVSEVLSNFLINYFDLEDHSAFDKNLRPLDTSSIFYSDKLQDFTLQRYIANVTHKMDYAYHIILCAIVYLLRVQDAWESPPFVRKHHGIVLKVSNYNIHRLFAASIIVAAKFWEDGTLKNKDLQPRVCVSTLQELNNLEKQLLIILDYDLLITEDEYKEFWDSVKIISGTLTPPHI